LRDTGGAGPGQYYYYNKWMRGRITASAPALPEPVVAKLLDMEAGELDLLLQYPAAAAAQVRSCHHVQCGPCRD
jgi:hypothetical protein